MCGIVGAVSASENVIPLIMEGLKRLEYRGYDSAGVATLEAGVVKRARASGKIINLENELKKTPLAGQLGISHTRWATHGAPTETNAHPHATDRVAVVHNGIIENHDELRAELKALKYNFTSDTDTEVVPVLITHYLAEGLKPADAVKKAVSRLEGAFALGIIIKDAPESLFAARHGAPLALAKKDGLVALGSDAIALSPIASEIAYLHDGDVAELTAKDATIWDESGKETKREFHTSHYSGAQVEKGEYRHFMLKEIEEQPAVIADTLGVYYNPSTRQIVLPKLPVALADIDQIQLIACGTSFYAATVAKYWFEQIARVPTSVDIASEFRYRMPPLSKKGLTIVISQSGETADTHAAMRYAKEHQPTVAIVNVPQSTIAREAGAVLTTYAGPEIGVASTKAFTTQLTVLAAFAIALSDAKKSINKKEIERLTHVLLELPSRISHALKADDQVKKIAELVTEAQDVLYLGRGTSFPIALEGALKLKEISYIHAEAYAAGEMKHGPIALIDERMPIIAIAPSDALFDKTASNLQEAAARGGKIIVLSDAKGVERLKSIASASITLPEVDPFITPIVYSIPVQQLAYHVAVLKGTDVDQPRNLAKSVTVE